MNKIVWSDSFTRKLKRLLLKQKLELIAENPFHLSLHTHKLRGD